MAGQCLGKGAASRAAFPKWRYPSWHLDDEKEQGWEDSEDRTLSAEGMASAKALGWKWAGVEIRSWCPELGEQGGWW